MSLQLVLRRRASEVDASVEVDSEACGRKKKKNHVKAPKTKPNRALGCCVLVFFPLSLVMSIAGPRETHYRRNHNDFLEPSAPPTHPPAQKEGGVDVAIAILILSEAAFWGGACAVNAQDAASPTF